MKIGVVVDRLAKGGVAKLVILEVKEMIRQGYQAELLVLWHGKEDNIFDDLIKMIPVRFISNEIPFFFKINFKIPFFSFFSFFHLSSFFYFPWVIKKKEYDVFIPHGTYTCFSTIAAKWFRKIPFIANIHDSIYFIIKKAYMTKAGPVKKVFFSIIRGIGYIIDRLICSTAMGIVKESNFEKDYFIKKHKVKNYHIIPSSTYERIAKPKTAAGDYFLAFTKWDFSKNFEFLADLLERIPDIRLVVAGFWHPPAYEQKVKSLLMKKNLLGRVEIIGPVKEEKIQGLYKNAIALVHPLFEEWGSTIYEAACNSTTFIAVEGSGVQEHLKNGEDGFFLRQNDLPAFSEKINLLKRDKKLALTMGRNAWKSIEKVDISHHVESMIHVYYQGLKNK